MYLERVASAYYIYIYIYTGPAKLVQQGFAGCLRDVMVQKSSGTSDTWEPLDWDTALEKHETYESWEGCPAVSEDGAYFLGHGTSYFRLLSHGLIICRVNVEIL